MMFFRQVEDNAVVSSVAKLRTVRTSHILRKGRGGVPVDSTLFDAWMCLNLWYLIFSACRALVQTGFTDWQWGECGYHGERFGGPGRKCF